MEIVVKKNDLNKKLVEFFSDNLRNSADSQNLDKEEKKALLVLNKKKIQADADNITNLVFSLYGVKE